jgi:hypothetical protein
MFEVNPSVVTLLNAAIHATVPTNEEIQVVMGDGPLPPLHIAIRIDMFRYSELGRGDRDLLINQAHLHALFWKAKFYERGDIPLAIELLLHGLGYL